MTKTTEPGLPATDHKETERRSTPGVADVAEKNAIR
jgi:hypothetical protein